MKSPEATETYKEGGRRAALLLFVPRKLQSMTVHALRPRTVMLWSFLSSLVLLAGFARQFTAYDALEVSLCLGDLFGIAGVTRRTKGVDRFEEVGLKRVLVSGLLGLPAIQGNPKPRLPQQALELFGQLLVALAHGTPLVAHHARSCRADAAVVTLDIALSGVAHVAFRQFHLAVDIGLIHGVNAL